MYLTNKVKGDLKMSILITLFLIYILAIMGLSITESIIKSTLHHRSQQKRIRLKRPHFIKKN